jgi:hypothetical protein
MSDIHEIGLCNHGISVRIADLVHFVEVTVRWILLIVRLYILLARPWLGVASMAGFSSFWLLEV